MEGQCGHMKTFDIKGQPEESSETDSESLSCPEVSVKKRAGTERRERWRFAVEQKLLSRYRATNTLLSLTVSQSHFTAKDKQILSQKSMTGGTTEMDAWLHLASRPRWSAEFGSWRHAVGSPL